MAVEGSVQYVTVTALRKNKNPVLQDYDKFVIAPFISFSLKVRTAVKTTWTVFVAL